MLRGGANLQPDADCTFWKSPGDLVVSGPTGTNVNDFCTVLVP
jgi:glycerate-2-kinase